MVKISEVLAQASPERPSWSFEFFPPKTTQGLVNLYERIGRMTALGPSFIDITWGAGGTTADLTTQFVKTAHEEFGLETCMHLTCTNMPKEKVETALREAKEAGCHNILALRGDPPRGESEWTAVEGGFEHAIDLIRYIRAEYGDYFDIAVAGFPEGHPQADSRDKEMEFLKAKVDAGATCIITQMFYDIDVFLSWVREVRKAGVTVPIVPGIMPIQGYNSFQRTTSFSSTVVPKSYLEAMEPFKDDDAKVREVGTKLVAELCRNILDSGLGINSIHVYTMNLEKGTTMLLEALKLLPQRDIVNPLPWRPSLTQKRRAESTRPIFWSNRVKSYLSRTESWDEFPNGRWGDSRSPAYGELDGYGVSIKRDSKEAQALWGHPKSLEDIEALFAKFCRGQISSLPWSDSAPAQETSIISEQLAAVNERGYLTINSQPAVDGEASEHPVHGWGPRHGYVYQKAYLEFFCPPEHFQSLVNRIQDDPQITYYAVNKAGDLHTNNVSSAPNAVTWGVFPGKEIVQPTIVEEISFMAWKDEAFELGARWASVYEEGSTSRALIHGIFDTFYLVNIVHNDYRNPDRFIIFKPFLSEPLPSNESGEASANWHATSQSGSNGPTANGSVGPANGI